RNSQPPPFPTRRSSDLLAYHGIGAIVGIGDLVSRSDLRGGRTNWGDVPLRVRDETIPNAALFKTVGAGMAWPGAGAQGHPSRAEDRKSTRLNSSHLGIS